MNRLYLFETDDDNPSGVTNNQNQANDNQAADNNDTAADNQNDQNQNDNDQNQDDNNQEDQQNNEDQNDENQDDNTDDEETTDDDLTIQDDDENNEEGNNEENGGDDYSSDDQATAPPDSLKAKDRELFDSLSIPEQQIKIKQLKRQFSDLYDNCVSIINRYKDITADLIEISIENKKIINILYDFKDMISFYILNIYDTKSYIENDIIFNRYLSVLNGIGIAVNSIKKVSSDDK